MVKIKEILAAKGSQVWSIGKDASVLEAAQLMNEKNIGGLLVTDDGRPVGMFTEKEVVRQVVAEKRSPADTSVGATMMTEVACCSLETTLEEARGTMRDRRIRHLPVMDEDGNLHGLVSIGDLNAHQLASHEQTIHMLNEYLYGRV